MDSPITDEELLASAEAQAAGEVPSLPEWAQMWIGRAAAGTLEEIEGRDARLQAALARGGARRWPSLCKAFDEGALFGSQHIDFTSMLLVKPEELERDRATWADARAVAYSAGAGASEKLAEMRAFADTRLAMDARTRAKVIAPDGSFRPLASLSKGAQDSLAEARQRYLAVAVRYRWWWATSDAAERERLKAEYAKGTDGEQAPTP